MAAIIAPSIARYTVHGTYAGRPVANVLDYFVQTPDAPSRAAGVEGMAGVIIQAWIDHIIENLDAAYTATEVSWVDLDSASGTVGRSTTGVTTNFPQMGTAVGDPLPGNVAVRVNKNITAARGQRQGRMYLPGLTEAQTDAAAPNSPSAAYIAALNADLASFKADTETPVAGPPTFEADLVVVHTVNNGTEADPDVVYNGFSYVDSMTTDGTLGSQRRRLRG